MHDFQDALRPTVLVQPTDDERSSARGMLGHCPQYT